MPHPLETQILDLRKARRTFREISEATGVSLSHVHRVCQGKGLGKSYNQPRGPKATPGNLSMEQIYAMFEQRVKPLAIAFEAGVSQGTVYRYRKRWAALRCNSTQNARNGA